MIMKKLFLMNLAPLIGLIYSMEYQILVKCMIKYCKWPYTFKVTLSKRIQVSNKTPDYFGIKGIH